MRRAPGSYGLVLSARSNTPVRVGLRIEPRTGGIVLAFLDQPPLELGHPQFERDLDTFCNYPDTARRLLTPERLTTLLGLARHGTLRVKDYELTLEPPTLPADPNLPTALLEDLSSVGAALHATQHIASPYR